MLNCKAATSLPGPNLRCLHSAKSLYSICFRCCLASDSSVSSVNADRTVSRNIIIFPIRRHGGDPTRQPRFCESIDT
jgi:hypothetical protein